ncbi:hypothetical protein [Kineosporia sp. A_224]|uniref:hypothetical protein n=1 Tax=Kineosporia sp. A_224 TaxID=1962180 RepID=UPI00130461A4|nr:hypothetical protein [Kineosporia sp. A_224]
MSTNLRAKLTELAKSPALRGAIDKARLEAAKPANKQRLQKLLGRSPKQPPQSPQQP